MNSEHISGLFEALIDKYTMRSKAHKKLTSFFIDTVLEASLSDIEQLNAENRIQLMNQNYQEFD